MAALAQPLHYGRTIADIATFPWVHNLVGFGDFAEVGRGLNAFVARPAVAWRLEIPKRS